MMNSVVQRVGDAASWVGDCVAEGTKNAVIIWLTKNFPELEPVLKSLQEMKISTTLIHSLRESLLAKLRNSDRSDLLSTQLSDYFVGDVPFLNIDSDANNVVPEQVSQLKKILNALYHTEEGLKLIEQHTGLLSTSTVHDLYALLWDLIPHVKELIQISSSLDVNLPEYFSGELAQLSSLITMCQQFAGPQVNRFLDGSTWSHFQQKASTVGHYAGVATDQLHPHSGQTDFHFLTTFGGVLSGHLSALTEQIQSYAAPSEQTPMMIQEKLAELQARLAAQTLAADELYRKLTQLQASGVADPMSIGAMLKHPFVYKEIFAHITELSTSIQAQIQQANEGTQDAIIHQLSELKNKHLLDLFCFIDKIELYGAFKPGALSKPVLIYLKTWYELLVTQAHSVVDIKKVRPALLVIEDSHFVHARMEAMLSRLATLTTKDLSLANVPDAMGGFFERIKHCQDLSLSLCDSVPDEDKPGLLVRYQFIRPFMLQKNPAFDVRLLRDLGHSVAQGKTEEPFVTVAECLQLEKEMRVALAKAITSQTFYRRLAKDMLQGIFSRVDTLVLPYSADGNNPFRIDESQMLGMDQPQPSDLRFRFDHDHIFLSDAQLGPLLREPRRDVHSHTLRLFEAYQIYLEQLALAQKACEDFKDKLQAPDWASHKPALRDLYLRIQPYLMHASYIAVNDTQDARIALDRAMVDCLGENHTPGTDLTSTFNAIQKLINVTLAALGNHQQSAVRREAPFKAATQAFLSNQVLDSEIELDADACKRLHHVFSHTRYSENVHKLSDAVRAALPVFSAPIRNELATAVESGLPFPVLADEIESLKTSDQVLLLKQLMNALYYLEYFFVQMENINHQSVEIANSAYLIKAMKKLNHQSLEIVNSGINTVYLIKAVVLGAVPFINIVNAVRSNPSLAIIMKDVLKHIDQIQGVWLGLKPLYSISSTDVGNPAEVAASNGTWYSMLGMTVLPEHLKALKAGLGFSPADAESHQILAKDTTLRIERILANSDTNFHLFLASPDMLKVFHRVKETLSQFSGETYESVMTHLQSIREETFPALLVETDAWERRLGIVPGTISTPVKKILDQFYLSLIEPLSLPSERHIELASSLASFDVRANALHFQMRLAETEGFRLEPLIEMLDEFVKAIESFDAGSDRAAFAARLASVLPLLRENKNRHSLGITRLDQDDNIDRLCHELMPNETAGLKHIKCLVKRCKADYEGRFNTQEFDKDMIIEQLTALSIGRSAQVADNLVYKTRHVTGLLHRHIERLVTEQKDILSQRESYGKTLKLFLLAQAATIVPDLVARECNDNLQGQMEVLLQVPLEQFAETEYRHFMKLQSILVAINAFESYLDQESGKLGRHEFLWFETEATIAAKRVHIVRMRDIANDGSLSAEIRLNNIQDELIQQNVQSDLSAYHQYDRLSWDGLKQLFWQLLQTVGLYTAGYEAEYARLNSAQSADAPEAAQFLQSYGLFNTRRSYPLPPGLQAISAASLES